LKGVEVGVWGQATGSSFRIGVAGFYRIRRASRPPSEIGYWVRSDRTGRGYATAAARALTRAALQASPLVHRVQIRCDPANLASAAIPPKLGYRLDEAGSQLVWVLDRVG